MKQENAQPLYQILNAKRVQGEFDYEIPEHNENVIYLHVGSSLPLAKIDVTNYGNKGGLLTAEATAAYTVLAVNNLAKLADALQNLLREARQNSFEINKSICDTPAEAAAAEALKSIS